MLNKSLDAEGNVHIPGAWDGQLLCKVTELAKTAK